MEHEFSAEIKKLEGKIQWSVIYFPHPAMECFGTNGRVNVKATVDGHEFDGTLLPSKNGHYMVYNAFIKKAVKKAPGDTVQVTIEQAESRPELVAPDYITDAFKKNSVYEKFIAQPYYMQREYINTIQVSDREETRMKQLQRVIEKLKR